MTEPTSTRAAHGDPPLRPSTGRERVVPAAPSGADARRRTPGRRNTVGPHPPKSGPAGFDQEETRI
ncbi:hypothetical protein [Streptomonospora wellingtoniae]|uniref:Uncharacterized protein n=1 Tax=Streptomonospora wellingtoniae TaxID=3075544 RepID=A0ABU2KPP1_9ACTN|nr:hypothetical protein [Streptomonospora sp. DSM 45055]MDT0301239.1 hypothetical protein [Streptomonospora sp. DSM 45055]